MSWRHQYYCPIIVNYHLTTQ